MNARPDQGSHYFAAECANCYRPIHETHEYVWVHDDTARPHCRKGDTA